jgi:hypothetical protein
MKISCKPLLAAFVAAAAVNLGGVLLFFDPIARADSPGAPVVPPAVAFFIYVVLAVALFDWVARQMRNAYKAAFVIAASQFILVNVDFVLTGKRGVMTGVASTVLIAATWICVAVAYAYFIRQSKSQ